MDWSGRFSKWPRAVSASNLNSGAEKIGKKTTPTNNTSKQAKARSRIQWQQKKKITSISEIDFFLPLFASLLLFCDFHFVLCGIFFPWLVSALSFDHIFCPSPPNPKGFCSKRPILPFLTSARMGVFKGWTQMNWWCSCILRKSVLPSQTLKNIVSMLIRRLFDEVLF